MRALNLIKSTMSDFDLSQSPDKTKENDLFQSAKLAMVRAHLKYLQFYLFRSSYKSRSFLDPRIVPLLDIVGRVLCLADLIEENSAGALFDTGFFLPGSLKLMQRALEKCVADLRP
mmetsp:Transcript_1144/g.1510  ORF Transcript_1144/g.1510 Transcript_1144/m.1510 type:complete len:116 (+) Transcript_1144:1512-1859(+)